MTPEGVTCTRLRLAHVTPSGVTSKNPHTLYTIKSLLSEQSQSTNNTKNAHIRDIIHFATKALICPIEAWT